MWSILSVLFLIYGASGQVPTVTLQQGVVVGSNASNGNYYEFYGIPFADSTSGSHRFKAPSPPPSFEETFIADRRDIKCIRAVESGFEGTEDCLVANVFTRELDSSRHLPVMVWIKGREFDKTSEPQVTFENFVEKDVVVVTLNFRESILGFLCLGTETAPGNAGLKDIVAGLHWVKENIAQFGGNPDDVTLFGHGSGAAAVDLITLSPMADNLVHKVISQSGTALAPWAVSRDNLKYAIEVARALGHIVTDIENLSDLFTRTSVTALMAVISDLELTNNALAFGPCLEKENLEGVEPFLTKSPYEVLADGNFRAIPFMTGFVEQEGTIRAEEAVEDEWLEKMDESFVDFLQTDLRFSSLEEEMEITNNIRARYFGEDVIDMDKLNDYITYMGDTMILVSAVREARYRVAVSDEPVYLYQFSYKGTLSESFEGIISVEAAGHREELAYLFSNVPENLNLDYLVSQMMIERWTNFAKTGNPTSTTSTTTWQPFTSNEENFLRILDDSEMTIDDDNLIIDLLLQSPHPTTITFWNDIYVEHFRDATSKFNLNIRDDEEIDDNDDNDDNNDDDDDDDDEDDDDTTTTEAPEEESEDDGAASITVCYTLITVCVFAILSQFNLF